MTPTIATTNGNSAPGGGAVRRKPARRANTAERRATHNAVERQRRETLNGRFLDLAALLPNLANVRRPSKSAIVNSSIALVHTQRRLRAIAARELRSLAHEAECLRREVNEWRMAHPTQPVPSLASESTPLETLQEPARSADFVALIELEDVSEDEMSMNEQERIAYEMRGGDSGPMGASFEDGEEEYGMGGDDLSDGVQRFSNAPVPAPTRNNNASANNRARTQSLSVVPQNATYTNSASIAQLQMQLQNQQAQAAASLIPSSYNPSAAAHQQQQMMMQQQQQQHQYAMQQQQQHQQQQQIQMQMAMNAQNGQGFFPPSFDAIAAAAAVAQNGQQNEQSDAAKLAAWNAHLFSALAAQRDHSGPHFPGQQQFHTPPSSSHGQFGPTPGQFMRVSNPFEQHSEDGNGSVHDEMDGANTPSSRSSTSMPPSLSLSISGLSSNASQSSQSNSPSSNAIHMLGMGGGMPSSLPSALASPLHNLSLSQSQGEYLQQGVNGGQGAFFGSAPAAGGNWAAMNGKSPVGTPVGQQTPPPMPVGGGNGGNGYHQYPMMSIFI